MAGLLASALAGGMAGMGDAAGKALFEQMKSDIDEQKAMRVLEASEGKAIAAESRKNAPMERFSGLVNSKMGEQIPLEAAPTTMTSAESGQAIGLKEGLTGDIDKQRLLLARIPDLTQRTEALAQLDAQVESQGLINAKAVEGKTRARSQSEAIKSALEDALTSDPTAYVAGRALTAADKDEVEDRKIASREKIEQSRIEQRDRSDASRSDAADRKNEVLMARIESAVGGKAGNKTALVQNAEYLKSLGYSDDKIEKFIFEKKEIPLEDVAAKILAADTLGEMTPEQAAQKAIALRNALNKASATPSQASAPPDGTRLRKNGQIYVVKGGVPVPENGQTSSGLIK